MGEFDAKIGARLRDDRRRSVFPVLNCAVETTDADPWSKWFAAIEDEAGRKSLQTPQPPLARELITWKHSPRLILDSATVIAPERWWCPADMAEQLRHQHGFDRFVSWRQWVQRAGIPVRTYAHYGTVGTETAVLSDSVLAVEVLGRALSQTDAPLRLQEMFFGDAGLWVQDEHGRRYMAEVAVAWAADDDFWSSEASHGYEHSS
jgi:hypothetical protein